VEVRFRGDEFEGEYGYGGVWEFGRLLSSHVCWRFPAMVAFSEEQFYTSDYIELEQRKMTWLSRSISYDSQPL